MTTTERQRIAERAQQAIGQIKKKHPELVTRPLYQIAAEIDKAWPKAYFGAVPYIAAMHALTFIDDKYGFDEAGDIVLYFLSNAKTWRGDDARRIKAELKAMAGIK